MADFAVGDLYDLTAARLKDVAIDETALYHCRFCADFKIIGKQLLSTDSARSHAAAHRIAFDALLDPKPVLTCLICDESVGEQGTEENSIINDLDLVHHLVANHNDLLSDELVGDFAEPSYLLTTYVDSSRLLHSSSDFLNGPSDDEGPSSMPDIQPNCSSADEASEWSQGTDGVPEFTLPEAQKNSHSHISCLQCNWDSRQISSRSKLKRKLISHIRSHIRLKLAEPCNEADSLATERLCCIEYVLGEYAETGELDLSNAQCTGLPSTYNNLLVETFGLSLPLVMRVVHGIEGNPFKHLPDEEPEVIELDADSCSSQGSPEAQSVPQGERLYEVPSGCSVPESLLVSCGRTECGNMVVDMGDTGAFIRHLAAHIRYDEKRLQRVATPLVCECGLASYTPQGFIYHEFRDHCFTKKAYSGFAKATVSYIVMVWDALIRSCAGSDEILLTLLEGPWQRTNIRLLAPLWGAFLCLENDEGDEIMFANSSIPCEMWLRKWKNLAGRDDFPGMDNSCSTVGARRSTYHSGVSELIRLLETHPFVGRLEAPRTKKHVYTPLDEKSQQRMFNVAWKQLNSWLASPLSSRTCMASTARWNQLYDIRRRVNYKKNKALIKTDGVRNIHWTDKDLAPFQCIPGLVPRQSDYVAPQFYISGREQIEINGRPDREEKSNCSAEEVNQTDGVVKKEADDCETKQEAEVEELGSCPDTAQENNHAMNFIVLSPDPSLKGQYRSCLICEDYYLPAENIEKITIHCAAHAILEARQLSNLYIHLQSERPLTCPFCLKEHLPYSPLAFMDHIEHEHHTAALFLYEKILKRELPMSSFLSEPVSERPKGATSKPIVFVIKCQRREVCGLESGILRLARGDHQNGYDTDKDVLNHILWHVKNDDGVKVGKSETELMSKVLSTRLIISNTNLSHRLIPIMTRKAIRHWPRLSRKEPEVLRFVLATLHEISFALFGVSKGLVFSMVFPRRWHRDQCGIFLYPACQCLLCAEIQLSKYSLDRRKRIFLSNVRPVLCHVIDHLDCGDIPQIANSCNIACPLDGSSFSRMADALNHVLNSHKNVMELSVLRNLLSDMGILTTFSALLKVVFGSQAWQLEEALGFDVFEQRKVPRPTFFEEMQNDYHYLLRDHRADCVRFRDAFAKHCQCGDVIAAPSSTAISKNGSSNGLPSESLHFYKEFLETEAEAGSSSDSADALSLVEHVPEACEVVVKTEPVDEEPSPVASPNPLPGTNIAEILSTLMCANLLATSLGTQPMFPFDPSAILGAMDPTAILGAIDPSTILGSGAVQAEELLGITPKRKPREKRKSSCSEEKHTASVTIDRNSQLPLKNVIQGTRTVAAAVAAALGTLEDSVDQPAAPAPVVKPNISAPNINTTDVPSGCLLGKRERRSVCEEESDLALGSMTKRVRQSSTSDAPKKKQRSRRRRQTMISSLLFSDDC